MQREYYRREFIQLFGLAGAGLLIGSCNSATEKQEGKVANEKVIDEAVEKLVSDDVVFVFKGDENYEVLKSGFNKRINKNPLIIAVCRNAKGVQQSVAYARKHQLEIAVKSGGHSFEGFSSNNGNMVINLSVMKQVSWTDDKTIQVQPGCTLADIYDAILPKGRILPAGSCGGVGIAGLALGGGYGFFSRKYGLSCDNLQKIVMVDGEGKIRDSDKEPELLWACRGGGNGSFGVVTEMTFKTHPGPKDFQSHRFKAFKLDAARSVSLLEQWFTIAAELPQTCFSAFVLNGKTLTILLTDFGDSPKLKGIIDSLSAITDKTSGWRQQDIARALKTFYGRPDAAYFKNASAGLYKDFRDVKECITQVIEVVQSHPGLIYQVNTLGGAITDKAFEEQSCYPHRQLPFLSELQAYWDVPEREPFLTKGFNEIQAMFAGNGISAHYVNYPDLGFKDWERAYFGDNYARLQAVKRKYDAGNIFKHGQSIVL
jgi:FAD/FMN-containing dehydrogenase